MTDQPAQEPTMEEILASIRRIISEDDAPAETASAAPAAPEPQPEPEPEPEPAEASPALMDETPSMQEPVASEEDVLELTDTYEAPAGETIGDLDVSPAESEPEPFPAAETPRSESFFEPPAEVHTPEHPSVPSSGGYDSLVGESAAASAASAFAGLASSLRKPQPTSAPRGPDLSFASGSTIEAMVAEMLRPMLKEWLDANLPGIVEAQVRKEVERIARSAG
jgi:cell pole-organizing protein PopZ